MLPLRRNRNFQLLWIGSSFSFVGKEITDLVYPLIILAVTGSPSQAALFGAVQTFAVMTLGIPGGEITDRYDRRRLLLLVEAVRLTATATVVVALATHALTIAHLLAVALVVGAVQPIGGFSRMLLVRQVVPPGQLTAAITQEEVRTYGASLAGPPLGGWLYGLAAAAPIVCTACCYALSLVFATFVRPAPQSTSPRPASDGQSPLRRVLAGLAAIWQLRNLRRVLLCTTALNIVSAPLALLVVIQLRHDDVAAGLIGVATTGLALGGLAGTALVGPLHRRLRPGTLMLGQAALLSVLVAGLAVDAGVWWFAAILLLTAIGVPSMRVLVDVVMFRQVPDDTRGRIIAAAMTVYGLGASAGMGAAGLLLRMASPATTALVLAIATAAVALLIAARPALRTAAWPAEPPEPAPSVGVEKGAEAGG